MATSLILSRQCCFPLWETTWRKLAVWLLGCHPLQICAVSLHRGVVGEGWCHMHSHYGPAFDHERSLGLGLGTESGLGLPGSDCRRINAAARKQTFTTQIHTCDPRSESFEIFIICLNKLYFFHVEKQMF